MTYIWPNFISYRIKEKTAQLWTGWSNSAIDKQSADRIMSDWNNLQGVRYFWYDEAPSSIINLLKEENIK